MTPEDNARDPWEVLPHNDSRPLPPNQRRLRAPSLTDIGRERFPLTWRLREMAVESPEIADLPTT